MFKKKSKTIKTTTKATRKKRKLDRKEKKRNLKTKRRSEKNRKLQLANDKKESRNNNYIDRGGHGFNLGFVLFRKRAKPNSPFFFNGKTYYATDKEYLNASRAKASYELEMNKILCNAPTAAASSPKRRRRAGSSINKSRRGR